MVVAVVVVVLVAVVVVVVVWWWRWWRGNSTPITSPSHAYEQREYLQWKTMMEVEEEGDTIPNEEAKSKLIEVRLCLA